MTRVARKNPRRRVRHRLVAALAAGVAAAAVATLAAGGEAAATEAPKNTTEPVITGTAQVGKTLTATTGTWSGTTSTFAFQWVRCGSTGGKPDGSDCTPIAGATGSAYAVVTSDVGMRLRVRVTAANADGSTTVASNATQAVVDKQKTVKPANTSLPSISGTPAESQFLQVSTGSWSGTSPSFSYRWLRCDAAGNNCSDIRAATNNDYFVRDEDVGRTLRARVTARNSAGSASATSAPTSVVTGKPAPSPSGIVTLPSGERSIPVTSVPNDQRLVIDRIEFSPNPVRSRTASFTVRVKVKDTRGFVVRDALVFLRSTPLVTRATADQRTGTDGWLTITLQPEPDFPVLEEGRNVQFFVKAFRAGDPVLAGVAGTRLVQVGLAQ